MSKKSNAKVELLFSDDAVHEHVFAELFFDDSPLLRVNIENGKDDMNVEIYDGYPECEGPRWKSVKLKDFRAWLDKAEAEVVPKK